jgi:hypothetical protein
LDHRHAAFYASALRDRAGQTYFWIDEKNEMITVWVHAIVELWC